MQGASVYVFVGYEDVNGNGDLAWRIDKRWTINGGRDPFWGSTNGYVTSNPAAGADVPLSVAVAPHADRFYVAGYHTVSPGDRAWYIEKRVWSTGLPDTAFGPGGALVINPSSGPDEATVVLDGGSYIWIIGTDWSPGSGDSQWRIQRHHAYDGRPDTSFGNGGIWTSNPSAGDDRPTCATGIWPAVLLVAGYDSRPGNRQWHLEGLDMFTGLYDVRAGGVGGMFSFNPSSGNDEIAVLRVGLGVLFLAGWDESPGSGDTQWRVEKRRWAPGLPLDPGFGTGGVVTSNPSAGRDELFDLQFAVGLGLWTDVMFLAGVDASPNPTTNDRQWRLERRFISSGRLVGTLGTGGVTTSNPTTGDDRLVAVDPWSRTLVGSQGGPGNSAWRIERRYP